MPNNFAVEIRMQDNQVSYKIKISIFFLNQIKRVNVQVEKAQRPKPYFGGYRNNVTGQAYHHAFTQTD